MSEALKAVIMQKYTVSLEEKHSDELAERTVEIDRTSEKGREGSGASAS